MRQWFHRLRAAAVALLAAAALVPLLASSATAAQVTVKDAAGDMWFYTDADAWAPAPGSTYGDFTRTTFVHTDTRVVIRSSFVELRRSGGMDLEARIRDDDGRVYQLAFYTYPDHYQGEGYLMTTSTMLDCAINGKVDYEANTIRVAFSRGCLGNPRYLEFRTAGYHYLHDPANNVYSDNPHDANAALPTLWSSRVRHGSATRGGVVSTTLLAQSARGFGGEDLDRGRR